MSLYAPIPEFDLLNNGYDENKKVIRTILLDEAGLLLDLATDTKLDELKILLTAIDENTDQLEIKAENINLNTDTLEAKIQAIVDKNQAQETGGNLDNIKENINNIINGQDILVNYNPSDFDENNVDYDYIGYLDANGNWYIQRFDVVNGRYRYFNSSDNYPINWANRDSLAYNYFNIIF